MNSIKKVPNDELYYSLSRLNEAARAVAYAKSPEDAEFFTNRYLRPQIERIDNILNNVTQSRKENNWEDR